MAALPRRKRRRQDEDFMIHLFSAGQQLQQLHVLLFLLNHRGFHGCKIRILLCWKLPADTRGEELLWSRKWWPHSLCDHSEDVNLYILLFLPSYVFLSLPKSLLLRENLQRKVVTSAVKFLGER